MVETDRARICCIWMMLVGLLLFRPYLDAVFAEVDDESGTLRNVVEEGGAADAGGGGYQSAFGGEEA